MQHLALDWQLSECRDGDVTEGRFGCSVCRSSDRLQVLDDSKAYVCFCQAVTFQDLEIWEEKKRANVAISGDITCTLRYISNLHPNALQSHNGICSLRIKANVLKRLIGNVKPPSTGTSV